MGWKDALLRVFAAGLEDTGGQRLDLDQVVRALDRIDADPELATRFDGLDADRLRREFLRLYHESAEGERS